MIETHHDQGMFRLPGRDDLGRRTRPILRRVLRKLEDQEAKEKAEAEAAETEATEAEASGAQATEDETTEAAASSDTAA